jgi:hypothetical protein
LGRRKRAGSGVSFFAFQDIITSVVGIFVLITLIMVLELAQTVAESNATSPQTISQAVLDSLAALELEVTELQAQFDHQNAAQSKSADTNRFNREQQLQDGSAKLKEIEARLARSLEIAADSRQSLKEAKKTEQSLMAESKAVESDRKKVDDLQSQRKKIQRYSSVMEIEKPIVFREQTDQSRFVVLIRLEDSKIWISDSLEKREQTFSGNSRIQSLQSWLARVDLNKRQVFLVVKASSVDDFEAVQKSLDDSQANWGFDVSAADQNFRLRFELDNNP